MNMSLPRITFWRVVLGAILIAGLCATVLRFGRGLGAATHLSDAFPWGLWIGFDVLCGVMLAAGGFTLTATVYIFHLGKFRPIIRPTVLTAFMGYVLVIVALFYDLGRGWFIWHPLIMWNPRSALFEVAWCVMLYNTVLALEFAPVLFERLRLEKALRIQHAIAIPLVILGVLLSTLHQLSLGSLYLIMPNKLHPLWYTPWLPVFFFLSAICVGLAMTIFESSLSARHFGKQLELSLLQSLGRVLLVTLLLYAAMRFLDLYHRGALRLLAMRSYETNMFLLEITLALILPIALLMFPKVRESAGGLYLCAVFVILGFITNRLNVAITGMEASAGVHYFPKWSEIAVTGSIVGIGFATFGLAVKYLPIFPAAGERSATPSAAGSRAAPELSHARS